MFSRSPERFTGVSLHGILLSVLVSVIVVGGTIGGFLIGHNASGDPYIDKVSALLATETNGMSLYDVVGKRLDDPLTASALAKLYDVPVGDRDALADRLRHVAWVPPYRPAPFVGHMARPLLGDDPHINILGFRDERSGYVAKPDRTVRIFLTGGSTAWGSGASSQRNTISYVLEQMLNERLSRVTGYRYEVINTGFPAWSTTQEKLLIQQRLVDMQPDAVVMFSGNNDIHWALNGRDIRWFYSYMDQNYMTMLNELYRSSGHPEWTFAFPFAGRSAECSGLGPITARNVEDAALATDRVKARLIFVLQPNIASTAKRLTQYEQRILALQNKSSWEICYQALRDALGGLAARNYRLLDLSRSFGELDENTELFVDYYHFADLGNRLVAQALVNQIDWGSIKPNIAVAVERVEPLSIVNFAPTGSEAGKPFNPQADGSSAMRFVLNRMNKNLLVVFGQSVLTTVVGEDAITASVPAARYATKGEYQIYIIDSMTGEISQPVVFHSR